MSTFLSRVAARAAGAQASATPRPAPRFDPVLGSDPVERAAERVASDPTAVVRRRRGPAPAPTEPVPRTRTAPAIRDPRWHEVQPPAAEPGLRRIELRETEAERIETAPPSSPSPSWPAARPAATPPPPSQWAPAAPTPLASATPDPASHPHQLPPQPPTAEQLPGVRVHIGRLEVRANLQQAPPPPRRREPEPAPQLSLTDYLHRSGRT